MTALFLDANIFLDFYRFGSDDIAEMQKLVALIKGQEIALYKNDYLVDEISRNREKVLSKTLGDLKGQKYGSKLPNYCSGLAETRKLSDCLKQANKLHSSLVDKVDQLIRDEQLEADKLINQILDLGQFSVPRKDVMEAAKIRFQLRNPPGKNDSMGDAIHWESLLKLPDLLSLDLVSKDGDFASDLDPEKINSFLLAEWKEEKGQYFGVQLFRSLGDYFRARYPQITLSDEQDKNDLIAQLQMSPNFSTTHFLIAKLSGYDFFTKQQVLDLFVALASNSQVGWIGADDDVQSFFQQLQPQAYLLPPEIRQKVSILLEVDDNFFSPF